LSDGFREFLEDQFAPIGGVSLRAMFGGLGIFRDGLMFALVADDTLYFRVDDLTKPDFEAENSAPFTYGGRGVTMSYWRAPEHLLENPDAFRSWAEKAIAAASRAAARKKNTTKTKKKRK
jgi:DNA transformation protein